MDIDLLRTFIELSRTRHFARTAQNLYVTQSTVSARIRLLEESVGAPLFTRERNNIQLTAAGEKLLRYAGNIMTTWHRAKQEISLVDQTSIFLLVGAMHSLWDILLQDWMKYVFKTIPNVVLSAEAHTKDVLMRRLSEGTMDLAFVFDSPQTEFHVTEIGRIPLLMVSSSPHLPVKEAISKDYILVEWGGYFANIHARTFPDLPAPRLRVSLGKLALGYITQSGGTAYLAEPMVRELLKEGRLHRVEGAPVIERSCYAIFSNDPEKQHSIQQALNYFIKPSALREVANG